MRRQLGELAERARGLLACARIHRTRHPATRAVGRHPAIPQVAADVESLPVGIAAGAQLVARGDGVYPGCHVPDARELVWKEYGKLDRILADLGGPWMRSHL